MCIVCADMSGQFRRADFLPEDLAIDRGLSAAARRNSDGSLAYLDVDGRGGTGPNGKASLLPGDAGAQITRSNQSWATGLGQAATVTYAYRAAAPTTMPTDTAGFTSFSTAQIDATELMLAAWSDVAQITFVNQGVGNSGPGAYTDTGTMLFGNYSSGQGGAAAFAYLPGGTPGNTTTASNAGNVWVNSSLSYNSAPTYLGYGYQVLLHEIGHAIGLSHPADYNAGPGVSITYSAHAIYYEDSRQYSVMSYFSERNTGGDFGFRYSSAPLLDDIAAAQRLYGANMTTRTGDTVYGFNSTAGRVWYDATQGGGSQAVIFAVWDAGGTDTLDFSGYNHSGINYNVNEPTASALIDLRQGHFSNVGGLVGNVSIAIGAVIENAIGGAGVETIIGNSADNRLNGRGGNDVIEGGVGSDTAVFSGVQASYTITPGTEVVDGVTYRILTVTGPDGTDVLRNVEFLAFSDATIAAPTAAAGIILEGDVTADNITGTAFADWLYGADGSDSITGGDGDDRINGGRGNDTLNGGNGVDTVDYAGSGAGVTVNLTTGTATGGAGTDTLSNFENIGGTVQADTLTGTSTANVINGAGGIDVLNGEGGNDTLIAGAGVLVGAPDVVKPSNQSNLSIGTAVNIDANFDLINDPGVMNATTIPHAVIRGTSSGGGQEYYAVTVTAGQICTFDIATATFDTTLRIFDSAGNQLAVNDDDEGSTNSLINHTFATSGTYYIAVGAYSSGSGASVVSGPPPFGAQYVLNVSVPNHAYVEAVGTGSTLNGGEGDDLLQGGVSNDTINGGNGSDTAVFAGNRSAWTITDNGGGAFTISNGSQTDTLTGVEFAQFADQTVALGSPPGGGATPGDDTLAGTSGDDVIDGLAGNDSIDGLAGNDVLTGGLGVDTLTGGLGNDRFVFTSHTQSTLASPDTITDFTSGSDTIDLAAAAQSGIAIARLGGQSFVYFSPNAGTYNGLVQVVGMVQGSDVLTGGIGVTMFGDDSAADLLTGTAVADVILGGGGADTVRGAGGADVLTGGSGADVFSFDAGDSTTSAYDTITDFTSASDVISLGGPAQSVFLSRLGGSTFVYYGLSGGAYQNVISVTGAVQGFDITASSVTMYGDGASNVLTGHTGNDTIVGAGGNDTLRGVGGADVLYGGEGNDTFAYGGASDSTMSAYDVIADFTTGSDRVNLTTLVGAGYSNVALARFGGSTFIYFGLAGAAQFDGVIQAVGDVNGLDLITGANLNLTIYGSSAGDDVRGGAGADTMLAGAGADYILGGAGGDSLFGGTGADIFAYTAASHSTATAWDTIQDFEVGVDRIDLRGVASSVLLSTFGGNTFVYFNPNGSGGYDGLIIAAGVTLTQDDVLVTGESAPLSPSEKDGGLTLPGLIDDDPWVLPEGFAVKDAAPLTHPLLDDPLVLPPGHDSKIAADEAPVVCLPTDVAVDRAPDDSSGSDRGLHWSDYQPRTIDWIY